MIAAVYLMWGGLYMISGWLLHCLHHKLHSSDWLHVRPIACSGGFWPRPLTLPCEIKSSPVQGYIQAEIRTVLREVYLGHKQMIAVRERHILAEYFSF